MENQREHTIVVTGSGSASATPDLAQLDVSLEVTDTDPAVAYTEVDAVAGRVVSVLDALIGVAGPALRLNGFSLASTDGATIHASAETAALADAHDRARRLAEGAGATLGPVVALRAEPSPHPQYAQGLGFRASSAAAGVQTGTERIHAQVVVTFALQH